jgi:ParB-like chromosome segregation protein Spo0J
MNAFVRPAKHVFLPLDEIDISHAIRPYNATVVGELARSIREIGLQTPLTCIVRDARHILVSGRNRLEALRTIGAEQAPVRVVDFTDVEAQLWRFSENLHRAELTKLEYDRQVVQYAELLKIKQAGEAASLVSDLSSIGALSDGEGISRQVGAKVGRPESGNKLAARELNIPEQTVRRAYQTASLSPEAQKAAVETGLDDNRSALLEAAKATTPEAQTETIRRLADRKSVVAEKADRYLSDQDKRLSPQPPAPVKPLRNLECLSAGEFARWIKLTTPNDRLHVVRMLRMTADILDDELQHIAEAAE